MPLIFQSTGSLSDLRSWLASSSSEVWVEIDLFCFPFGCSVSMVFSSGCYRRSPTLDSRQNLIA